MEQRKLVALCCQIVACIAAIILAGVDSFRTPSPPKEVQ